MKDEFGGVLVEEFVGLKSKMYSMKKIYGKEYNTVKGLSIAIEFDKFNSNVLFSKKILRHKMRRIESKLDLQSHDSTHINILPILHFWKYTKLRRKQGSKYRKPCSKDHWQTITL